jgi:hypothetical protein
MGVDNDVKYEFYENPKYFSPTDNKNPIIELEDSNDSKDLKISDKTLLSIAKKLDKEPDKESKFRTPIRKRRSLKRRSLKQRSKSPKRRSLKHRSKSPKRRLSKRRSRK